MIAAIALLLPVIAHPLTMALGSVGSEAPAHLWGLWTTSDQLFEWGPYLRADKVDFPVGFASDLIDPVSLIVFYPVWLLSGGGVTGAVLAWNVLHLVTVLLAGWGGWRLARRVLPDPAVWPLVVAACATVPYLMATAALGRSEYLAGAWFALHLSYLHDHLSPERRRRDTVGAILTLTGLAHSGWALALWVAVLEIPFALSFSKALPDWRTRVRRLAEVGLPAILLTLPFAWTVFRMHPWWLARMGAGSAGTVVLAVPLQDLFRFLPNFPVGGGVERAPWPGTVLPVLAIIAFWRRTRESALWGLCALGIVVCAMGAEAQWATAEGPPAWKVYAPVSWLMALIPPVRGVQNWTRLAVLLGAPLGVAGAWALAAIGRRRARWHVPAALGLAALVVVDNVSWAWPGLDSRFQPALSIDIGKLVLRLPEGPVLELPASTPPEPGQPSWDDLSLLWHNQHGHPTSIAPSPTVPSALSWSATARALRDGAWPPSVSCAQSESARLYNKGFRSVVFYRNRVPAAKADNLLRGLSEVLGAPTWRGTLETMWTLRAGSVPPGCEGPLGR